MIYSKISSYENILLKNAAFRLGVSADDLYKIINFESGWNPLSFNKKSSARGLIQFTDSTARSLGFMDSLDLVSHNPTVIDQLPIVEMYLHKFRPFKNKQELYMSIFYPDARKWNPGELFSDRIQALNPGITTVASYIAKVDGVSFVPNSLFSISVIVVAGILALNIIK